MMAGFIAMHISANQAFFRYIFVVLIILFRQMHGEQLIQFVYKHSLPSHQVHHAKYVMGHMEREVPGISLNEPLTIGLQHIKVLLE